MSAAYMRPIERRILAMREEGLSYDEIGDRLRKSGDRVAQIAEWSSIPRQRQIPEPSGELLSPIQRRVVTMRAEGRTHEEIGDAFRRSARFIKQVEGLARFRQYRDLLG